MNKKANNSILADSYTLDLLTTKAQTFDAAVDRSTEWQILVLQTSLPSAIHSNSCLCFTLLQVVGSF